MKKKMFFPILLLLLVSCSRTNIGQLTSANANANMSYCIYTISKQVSSEDNVYFFNVGDTVCIECCTSRNPKPWPAKIGANNPCPSKVRFTSSDGQAVYDADATSNRICSNCTSAKGFYACPN